MSSRAMTEGKHSLAYMYNSEEGDGPVFIYKALSMNKWIRDDFLFFSIDSPSE